MSSESRRDPCSVVSASQGVRDTMAGCGRSRGSSSERSGAAASQPPPPWSTRAKTRPSPRTRRSWCHPSIRRSARRSSPTLTPGSRAAPSPRTASSPTRCSSPPAARRPRRPQGARRRRGPRARHRPRCAPAGRGVLAMHPMRGGEKVGFTADEAAAAAAIVDALGPDALLPWPRSTRPSSDRATARPSPTPSSSAPPTPTRSSPPPRRSAGYDARGRQDRRGRAADPRREHCSSRWSRCSCAPRSPPSATRLTRYEPLVTSENQKALAALATIDWKAFPFAAILVPGLGPVTLDTPLSEGGRLRCDYARARFDKKLAPLIVLSGGHVHPDRTPYSEAIEMKKYLRAQGVPESALLVDPHARHTTTNLRNVGRILLRAGVAPASGTTARHVRPEVQTLYMSGSGFSKRCPDGSATCRGRRSAGSRRSTPASCRRRW